MLSIGTGELIVLLLAALLILGPERMPKVARWLGRLVSQLQHYGDDVRRELRNLEWEEDEGERKDVTPPAAEFPEYADEETSAGAGSGDEGF